MLTAIRTLHGAAGAAVTALGVVVLGAWALDMTALPRAPAGGVTIKADTALGFALAGTALWLSGFGAAPVGGRRALARTLAAAVAALGGLTLLESATGWNPGLDTLLSGDPPGAPATSHAGRMSAHTALAFFAAGGALCVLETRASQWLVLGVLLPALAAALGYVYAVTDLTGPFSATAMATHTAAGFAVLGAGILAARPERGVMAWLASPGVEGIVARRLLLFGAPLLLTCVFLSNLGRRAGLYSQDVEAGLDAFGALVLLGALTLTCVSTLARVEAGRKRSAQALRESEARYREVVEGSTVGMAIRQNSRIRYANPAFLRIFGYPSSDALLGLDYFETLAAPEDRPLLRERTAGVYRGEHLTPHPGWRGIRRDGSHICVTTSASLIDWEGGPAIVSFVTDITERRRAEEEIQALNRDLETRVAERTAELATQNLDIVRQSTEIARAHRALEEHAASLSTASKYKSEFLSNMSHELRTPLNSLLILSRLLADNRNGNLNPEQVEYAETVHQSGSDLLKLINEILDLSKIEAGQVDLHIGTIALANLREKIDRTFRHVAQSKNLDFSVSLAADVPAAIRSDADRLEQVLKNLLSNAFKFTEHGGVRLEMLLAAQGWSRPHPSLDEAAAVIALVVTDTGIGIAPDQQQRIFEAFRQADGTTSRRYGGTGLGLSISREIAAQLGGAINLESQPGKGSSFTLYLPLEDARSLDRPPDPATLHLDHSPAALAPPVRATLECLHGGGQVLTGAKVLVVDDDIRNVYALFAILESAHIEVRHADNGSQCLEILGADAGFDAVLMDIMMPEMDGYETLRRLRRMAGCEHLPVIALTAKAMKGDREACLAAGASDYLAKPVDAHQLLGLLRSWIQP